MSEALKGLLKALTHPVHWLSSRANRWRLRGARIEVIACILCRNPTPSILLGQSPYHDMWMPPQEGVNFRETFKQALVRCLKDECGLSVPINPSRASRKLHFRSTRFIGQLLLPRERHGERPIADDVLGTWLESVTLKRKAYWMTTVLVSEQSDISPKPDGKELVALEWHSLEQARNVIVQTNHSEKAQLLLRLLDACERDLCGAPKMTLAQGSAN